MGGIRTHNLLSESPACHHWAITALLHHITSHYNALHNIASHYIKVLHTKSNYVTLHHITSHYITLLSYYGIRGTELRLIKKIVTNTVQLVNLNDVKSEYLPTNCGVPQGSILGPLLFILYINDISNFSSIIDIILFADDTNIFFSDKCLPTLESRVNTEIQKISRRLKINKLSQNIKKKQIILFLKVNKN